MTLSQILTLVEEGVWTAFILGCGVAVWAIPFGAGSISLRSTEPLRVSSADAVTIPIAASTKEN